MNFSPRPYQRLMIQHILEHERCALWCDMGMGKTSSTLAALEALSLLEPAKTLVLGPLRVVRDVWPAEVEKWQVNLPCSPIIGSEKERLAAMRKDAAIYTCNYENLPWLVKTLGGKWHFANVVADEATRLKGFRLRGGGQRAAALGQFAHTKVKRFIELTGTPAVSGLESLWGQMWYVSPALLGRTLTAFRNRWFARSYDGFSYAPQPFAQAQIEEILKDVCLSIKAEDYFDVTKPIFRTIEVELPSRARQLYRDMTRNLYIELASGGIEAVSAGAKTNKLAQLANGAIYDESKEWREVHDTKLQALDSLISELNGKSLIVCYHFKSDLARLKKAFPKGRELDQKSETLKSWNAGKIPLLFVHPMSAGHGLNLADGGADMCFFSNGWSAENRLQAIERIGPVRQTQAGHPRPVTVYDLVATNTIDEDILARFESRTSVEESLRNALKTRAHL